MVGRVGARRQRILLCVYVWTGANNEDDDEVEDDDDGGGGGRGNGWWKFVGGKQHKVHGWEKNNWPREREDTSKYNPYTINQSIHQSLYQNTHLGTKYQLPWNNRYSQISIPAPYNTYYKYNSHSVHPWPMPWHYQNHIASIVDSRDWLVSSVA